MQALYQQVSLSMALRVWFMPKNYTAMWSKVNSQTCNLCRPSAPKCVYFTSGSFTSTYFIVFVQSKLVISTYFSHFDVGKSAERRRPDVGNCADRWTIPARDENGNWPLLRNPDKEVRNKYGNTRDTLYLDTLKIRKLPLFSSSTKYQGNHLLFRIFYLSLLRYLTYIKSAPEPWRCNICINPNKNIEQCLWQRFRTLYL